MIEDGLAVRQALERPLRAIARRVYRTNVTEQATSILLFSDATYLLYDIYHIMIAFSRGMR
jgi:hypothetical protein